MWFPLGMKLVVISEHIVEGGSGRKKYNEGVYPVWLPLFGIKRDIIFKEIKIKVTFYTKPLLQSNFLTIYKY